MYLTRNSSPKEGQLCICKCPNWNELGFQIATFKKGEFTYPEQPNDAFDKNVIAYCPINEDGNQIHTLATVKAKKYDALEAKISACYDEGSQSDLTTIGEIVAGHFGWL